VLERQTSRCPQACYDRRSLLRPPACSAYALTPGIQQNFNEFGDYLVARFGRAIALLTTMGFLFLLRALSGLVESTRSAAEAAVGTARPLPFEQVKHLASVLAYLLQKHRGALRPE